MLRTVLVLRFQRSWHCYPPFSQWVLLFDKLRCCVQRDHWAFSYIIALFWTQFNVLVFTGHIHQDKPNASICSQFLIGRCHKGLRCINHHCSMPYHWQYNFQGFDEWKSFSEKDNSMLEKLYCDVNVETKVNFKSAQSLDISGLNRRQVHTGTLTRNITISRVFTSTSWLTTDHQIL